MLIRPKAIGQRLGARNSSIGSNHLHANTMPGALRVGAVENRVDERKINSGIG